MKRFDSMMQKWARQFAYWILGNTTPPTKQRRLYTILKERSKDFYTHTGNAKNSLSYLMNKSEHDLYDLLMETLQVIDKDKDKALFRKFYVFPQVPLNQIIQPKNVSDHDYLFEETGLLRVDFVLCNYLMMPVCIIEVDGDSHTLTTGIDKIRDAFCKEHGIPILRLPADYASVTESDRPQRCDELFKTLRNTLNTKNKFNMYNKRLCQNDTY